jgi:hypothetical protein
LNGLSRNSVGEFYIELKVDKANETSHMLCHKFAGEIIGTKQESNYLKLMTA